MIFHLPAGLKVAGESKLIPLQYYGDIIGSTLTLLTLMKEFGCRSIVFSSAVMVYGVAKDETAKLKETDEVIVTITNCYGRTKYMIEEILGDFHSSRAFLRADGQDAKDFGVLPSSAISTWQALIQMGKDPSRVPNNLIPFVAQVAVGRRPHVGIFGNDY